MTFWQGFIGLSALAMVFVLWPVFFTRKSRGVAIDENDREQANASVMEDHVKDLQATLDRGEIAESEFDSLKQDLEQTFIRENASGDDGLERPIVSNFRSRIPLFALVLLLPLFALVIYFQIGAKADWDIYALTQEATVETDQEAQRKIVDALIEQLQQRLAKKPNNSQNWYLLAGTAVGAGDFDEAVRAYRKVLEIEPNAPQVIAELAQALFLRAGNTITPEVRKNTQLALELNPNMPTALGLAGIDAFQSGKYDKAVSYWQNAVSQLDPQSSASKVLSDGILRAKLALKQVGGTSSAKGSKDKGEKSKKDGDSSSTVITVKVSLDKKVEAKPDATVFVYARAWQGPKMPLAIQKLKVSDLPKKVRLDQSMAMAPGMDLTSFPQVEVVARVSDTGNAIPQPGDWQESIGPVIVSEQRDLLSLTISQKLE